MNTPTRDGGTARATPQLFWNPSRTGRDRRRPRPTRRARFSRPAANDPRSIIDGLAARRRKRGSASKVQYPLKSTSIRARLKISPPKLVRRVDRAKTNSLPAASRGKAVVYEKPPARKYARGIELRHESAFDATPARTKQPKSCRKGRDCHHSPPIRIANRFLAPRRPTGSA